MNKEALQKLLVRALNELQNLRTKVDASEPAGWEGVRRRCVLEADIKDAIQLLSYKVT